uniref:Uncharacterized protein n=1 Tax=Anguilla anguilla TaxID=7936 RepID=A0A0E9TVE7_ANGAN
MRVYSVFCMYFLINNLIFSAQEDCSMASYCI